MTRDFVHFSHNDARDRGLRRQNDGMSTGAFLIRPPTRSTPSIRMGLRGASLLLLDRPSALKAAISLENASSCTHLTIVSSASLMSSPQKGIFLGSMWTTPLDTECSNPFAARFIRATNLRNLYQSEKYDKILDKMSSGSVIIVAVQTLDFFTSGSPSGIEWQLGWRGHVSLGSHRNWGPFFPEITHYQGLHIKATGSMISWIQFKWHITPLRTLTLLQDSRYPVCHE